MLRSVDPHRSETVTDEPVEVGDEVEIGVQNVVVVRRYSLESANIGLIVHFWDSSSNIRVMSLVVVLQQVSVQHIVIIIRKLLQEQRVGFIEQHSFGFI